MIGEDGSCPFSRLYPDIFLQLIKHAENLREFRGVSSSGMMVLCRSVVVVTAAVVALVSSQ
jgi:hypothetical protein